MHGVDRYGTAYAMTILAEEELSKAFLLYLVQDQAVPWSAEVRRAIRNHESKHLLSFLMDYLAERWEHWLEHPAQQLTTQEPVLIPRQVAAAINLFRHEKIGKWKSPGWDVLEPDDYDPQTKRVADGSLDRAKQSAIYVNIGRDGTVLTTPLAVSQAQVEVEMERAKRLKEIATDIGNEYVMAFREYDRLKEVLRAVFQPGVVEPGETPGDQDAQQPPA